MNIHITVPSIKVDIHHHGATLTEIRAELRKLEILMTAQADALNAKIDALTASESALITLAASIKAALDAAIANGTGLTADEVAALSARLDGLKTAADDAVAADTPVP